MIKIILHLVSTVRWQKIGETIGQLEVPKSDGDRPLTCVPSLCSSAVTPAEPADPCRPNPCGANSQCNVAGGRAVCSCLPGFIVRPPNCRPECVVHQDCRADQACIGQKCRDPCVGVCGVGADCLVRNHNPICSCPQGYTGDPFTQCTPRPQSEYPDAPPPHAEMTQITRRHPRQEI